MSELILPKPTMRVTGGHANVPRGEPEFVPLNPWGRDIPKDLIRRPTYAPLYQVLA